MIDGVEHGIYLIALLVGLYIGARAAGTCPKKLPCYCAETSTRNCPRHAA